MNPPSRVGGVAATVLVTGLACWAGVAGALVWGVPLILVALYYAWKGWPEDPPLSSPGDRDRLMREWRERAREFGREFAERENEQHGRNDG